MNEIELELEYFEWMYRLVCNDIGKKGLTFRKLMKYLHHVDFTPTISRDENRAIDGVDFRYRFGVENGYPRSYIKENLVDPLGPCRLLEMMVALSFAIEERIMDDPDYGNRTGQWFWNMIVSLGLGMMDDSRFYPEYVDDVVYIFMNREYQANGRGGLFTLENPRRDLTEVEIWSQAMWYLDENFDFTV